MKRPLHTMTPSEFRIWSKNIGGELEDHQTQKRIDMIFNSLYSFYRYLSLYGNFDSIQFLIDNNFDLSFQIARQNELSNL